MLQWFFAFQLPNYQLTHLPNPLSVLRSPVPLHCYRLNSSQAAKIFFAFLRDRVILRLEVFFLSRPSRPFLMVRFGFCSSSSDFRFPLSVLCFLCSSAFQRSWVCVLVAASSRYVSEVLVCVLVAAPLR